MHEKMLKALVAAGAVKKINIIANGAIPYARNLQES